VPTIFLVAFAAFLALVLLFVLIAVLFSKPAHPPTHLGLRLLERRLGLHVPEPVGVVSRRR
jgi:hypothetical protein